jgi:hypothetical protein
MNQSTGSWEEVGVSDEAEEDEPDPWFRPVWEDLPDESDIPPLTLPTRSPSVFNRTKKSVDPLLLPLETATAALSRLDSQAELLPLPLQQGLVARMAYAEAAGWLASQGLRIHELDLSLLDSERIDRRELYARSLPRGTAAADPLAWLDTDDQVRCALALARLLRRLPVMVNPLLTTDLAASWLAPLSPKSTTFDTQRFAAWYSAHGPDRRRLREQPVLLQAAAAAFGWMEEGICDCPVAVQALAVAAFNLQRSRFLRVVPLPIWAGWRAVGASLDASALPRLRSDISDWHPGSLHYEGAAWPMAFLRLATEGAWPGLRTLAALRNAAAAGAELAAKQDSRSKLPDAITHLIREPAVSASTLAKQLQITPQAALRILSRLVEAGIATELTGRKSFRAFAVAYGR